MFVAAVLGLVAYSLAGKPPTDRPAGTAPDERLLRWESRTLRLTDGTRRLVTCRDVRTAVETVNTLRLRRTTAQS
jgi:hypothetical protein